MNLGYLDIAIFIVLVLGCVRGVMIGLVRQTTNLFGIILTVILAIALTRPVGLIIQENTDWPHSAALVVAFLGIFLVVKMVTVLVAKSADGAVDALHLSGANRISGGIFGAFKAALLLSAVFLILGLADWPEDEAKEESILYGSVDGILPMTWEYLSGKAPVLDEYRQKIEDKAKEGVEQLGSNAGPGSSTN